MNGLSHRLTAIWDPNTNVTVWGVFACSGPFEAEGDTTYPIVDIVDAEVEGGPEPASGGTTTGG